MEKWPVLWICFLLVGVLPAQQVEVRSYQVGWGLLERVWWAIPDEINEDPFASPDEESLLLEELPFWKEVKDPSFESRFFAEGGELRDCQRWVAKAFAGDFEGKAIYDMKQRRLVVQAEAADHVALARVMDEELSRQSKWTVSVYEMPFRKGGIDTTFWEEIPKEARELASLSSVGISGQSIEAGTPGGELSFVAVGFFDRDGLAEPRLTARFRKDGQRFEVKSAWLMPMGINWVEELGSRNGEKSLIMTVKADLITSSGILYDEWILKEKGGALLAGERLQRLRWSPELQAQRDSFSGIREFLVPPTLLTFLSSEGGGVNGDPFAADEDRETGAGKPKAPPYRGEAPELKGWKSAGLLDLQTLLQRLGIEFREGDFAVFEPSASTVIAKLDQLNMELLDGIVCGTGPDPAGPRLIRVRLEQWDGGSAGELPGDKVVQSLGLVALPGQPATLQFGRGQELEVEGQIDANDDILELRFSLHDRIGKKKKLLFQTGVTAEADHPVVLHESTMDGKRRAWILKGRVIQVGEELDLYLKSKGR